MSVGFALRFGDFPPAVMLPPAPVVAERRSPVIEAQIVPENTAISSGNTLSNNNLRRGMQSKQFFHDEAPVYTAQGTSGNPLDGNGLLLDLYA